MSLFTRERTSSTDIRELGRLMHMLALLDLPNKDVATIEELFRTPEMNGFRCVFHWDNEDSVGDGRILHACQARDLRSGESRGLLLLEGEARTAQRKMHGGGYFVVVFGAVRNYCPSTITQYRHGDAFLHVPGDVHALQTSRLNDRPPLALVWYHHMLRSEVVEDVTSAGESSSTQGVPFEA